MTQPEAKERFRLRKNELARLYYLKHKETIRARNKEYVEKNRNAVNSYAKRYYSSSIPAAKHKARKAVNNALRSGKLIKKSCKVCGNFETTAHHHDYTKPLDVIWLCKQHHQEADAKTKQI